MLERLICKDEHSFRFLGTFIKDDGVDAILDIPIETQKIELQRMVRFADRSGLISWRVCCERCGYVWMFGGFPSQNEVESVKI